MIHPIKSIIARRQSYLLNNFNRTKYNNELKKFKNIHNGESCFIIGNGPSLSPEDLSILHDNNVSTFAFNRIYYMFDKTQWRPTYYISQDEKTLCNCLDEVNAMDLKYKFIPLQNKFYHNGNVEKAIYFNLIPRNEFTTDVSQYVTNSSTVACTAVQFAVYMGFKKIYLLGMDHSFSVYKNDKGEIIKDENVRDYFSNEYNHDKEKLYIPNLDQSTKSYLKAREFCVENNVEIYNATRGGKLEVFKRINFDSLFVD